MIKQQLIQARDLIKQKRYDDARVILYAIEHPTAKQWLAKLNRLAPPTGETEIVEAKPPTNTQQIKAQMLQARDLILQKNYDAARALLKQVDHPAAKEWLGKLTMLVNAPTVPKVSTGQLSSRQMPAQPAAPASPDLANHDEILRQAQEALLKDQYDQARALLEPLKTPEAAFWLEKTGMTRFRTYENIWLDVFRYTLPLKAKQHPESWTCSTCGRSADQALSCPQRDQNPCPVKISARNIEEPRRLALLLQALYLDQHDDIEKIMVHIDTARLAHWKTELKWQVDNMNQVDVRRATIEEAIPLLDRHVKGRVAESKQAVIARAKSDTAQLERRQRTPPPPPPQPSLAITGAAIQREIKLKPAPPLRKPLQPEPRIRRPQTPEEKSRVAQVANAIIRFFINQ